MFAMIVLVSINGYCSAWVKDILAGDKDLVKLSSVGKYGEFSFGNNNITSNTYFLINGDNCVFVWKYDNGISISSLPVSKIYIEYQKVDKPIIRFKWDGGVVFDGDINGAMNKVIYAFIILKKETASTSNNSTNSFNLIDGTNSFLKVFTDNPIGIIKLEKE